MHNLLSVKQIAFILKVHPLTIRRYINTGKLKAVKVGGNIRIAESELENFHTVVKKEPQKKRAQDKYFTLEDPFLKLQGYAASLKLNYDSYEK